MTSVTPVIQVLVDDGSGTYPIDITSRVNKSDGVSVSGHGRTDEFSQATAATFSCTLKNDDGYLSGGGVGFGGGGFGGGGFGGGGITLTPGQGIRYKQTFGATTVNRFTGRISEAALGFTSVGKASAMAITAVDPLASLARRPLRSMLEQEILLDHPTAYYTLGEAEGSTSAGDTSGNGLPSLNITGNGSVATFGTGTGPTDGLPAVTFAGGQYLAAAEQTLGTGSWSVALFFSTTTSPPVGKESTILADTLLSSGVTGVTLRVGISSAGFLTAVSSSSGFTIPTASASIVTDGLVHCAVITQDGTNLRLYVDGVLTGTTLGGNAASPTTDLTIGKMPYPYFDSSFFVPYTGVLSHVALFDGVALSGARAAAYGAALTGFTETTAARFTRIASYVGMTTSTPSNSGQLVGAQDTSGSNALDALQTVATSEGGVMFANGSGTLVMQGRGYRAANVTADLTIAGKDIDVGTTVPLDDQQIVNQVTVSRQGGATQTYPSDLALGSADRFPQSLDLIVTSDDDALAAAQWLATKHANAVPRIGSATVKLLTSSQAEQIIAAEIGDRWALSAMPTQLWVGAGDLSLEGWSETLTVSGSSAEWSMTVNLLPFSLFAAALYDDAGSLYDTPADVYAY